MPQLPRRDEDRVQELLDLRVAHLGLAEYLTDEVNGFKFHLINVTWLVSLNNQDGTDHMGGYHYVEKEFLVGLWSRVDWWVGCWVF
ncbi:hypothetical protein C2845_PM01G48380 [Panicum miliaceum]|uniref:Uncharacterized protein n=1 Tax=Panicum miliaceum TaxID=4540 RepID=A0A3L6TMA5_PANMI|nr:hypothetical protein C2845_PM01G48380 [Panicum miliaceum]